MNANKKGVIFEMLRELAVIIGQEITLQRLELYSNHLVEYSVEEIALAIREMALTCKFFPSLAEIIKAITPVEDKKDLANEMAGAILQAMLKHGPYKALEAKAEMDPVSWFAIESFGGWSLLCKTEEADLATVRAQLRDMCSMAMNVSNRQEDNKALLPFQRKSMQRLGDCLKENILQIENK